MPTQLRSASDHERLAGYAQRGDKQIINAGDLDQETLKAGTEVTVWSQQVPGDKVAWWGHGVEQRDYAKAFTFLDLVASGNGTGTAGDAIEGNLVAVYTDSQQERVLAETTVDALGELADAKDDKRTDRPIFEAHGPHAKSDRYLELRVVAASGSDGVEVDPSASSGRTYYTTEG